VNVAFLAVALVTGLRMDVPAGEADYPPQFGLGFDARWALIEEGYLGLGTSWAGGVNDQNANRLRIAQRVEVAALLGGRVPADGWGLGVGARAGLMGVFGWPRGLLTNLQNDWGPWLAFEARADFPLSDTWQIEPRIGLGGVRLVGDWIPVLFLGLDLAAVVGR
jgi:hypothetical protein